MVVAHGPSPWIRDEDHPYEPGGAVIAQLASARLSEWYIPGSILGDLNVCFDFPMIRVAIALNFRKTDYRQREKGKWRTVGFH